MSQKITAFSPVRIYIVWHPGFDRPADLEGRHPASLTAEEKTRCGRGLKLARRIYYWFRLENMEGIPVYFRSASAEGSEVNPPRIPEDLGVLNYIIPLVDAHMVSSPDWREYVAKYAERSEEGRKGKSGKRKRLPRFLMLPVAMESVAYNMPDCMRKLNFIRHVPSDARDPDDSVLIARLTEVLCRDLREWLHQEAGLSSAEAGKVPEKIKIFLSHAKADDTIEAVALKEYIQRETQCEAFFDETDIASGYDYSKVLTDELAQESSGLIVIQGDNYADRPWCRKEIRDFLRPVRDPLGVRGGRHQFFVPPAVVVQTMKGKQIARTISELGYSPCVRWQDNSARFVVTTLLREILFGSFYRVLANRLPKKEGNRAEVFLNRSPDPVMITRILADETIRKLPDNEKPRRFVHPGYGLSAMEKKGLKESFPESEFSSCLGRSSESPENGTGVSAFPMMNLRDDALSGKIIAVSVGNSGDILERGLGDEHIQELLIRLVRPLLRKQASLLYGGAMPKNIRPETPWMEPLNFTGALLQLLLTERASASETDQDAVRLYVPTPCHMAKSVTAQTIAQWTDVCSFVTVSAEESGVEADELTAASPVVPSAEELEYLSDSQKRDLKEQRKQEIREFGKQQLVLKARCLSAMRRKICDTHEPLSCELPDKPPGANNRTKTINTFAHIFIGGKTEQFTGIMPGVFEEVLHAFKSRKPVFLIPEGGGAAGRLAYWLSRRSNPKRTPDEFTTGCYDRNTCHYAGVREGLDKLAESGAQVARPAEALAEIWELIHSTKTPDDLAALMNNGLSGEQNHILLTATRSADICRLVWEGITALCPRGGASGERAKPKRKAKPK